jgi:hypothetical protein
MRPEVIEAGSARLCLTASKAGAISKVTSVTTGDRRRPVTNGLPHNVTHYPPGINAAPYALREDVKNATTYLRIAIVNRIPPWMRGDRDGLPSIAN